MQKKKTPEQELTVVVPVYNEAASLPHFLPNLIKACKTNHWQAIFVNDGSKDASAQILSGIQGKPFTRVLHHKLNKGYGGALKTGISAATTRYVMTMDADGQHDIADIESLLDFAQKNNADMVVGTRRNIKHASPFPEREPPFWSTLSPRIHFGLANGGPVGDEYIALQCSLVVQNGNGLANGASVGVSLTSFIERPT